MDGNGVEQKLTHLHHEAFQKSKMNFSKSTVNDLARFAVLDKSDLFSDFFSPGFLVPNTFVHFENNTNQSYNKFFNDL